MLLVHVGRRDGWRRRKATLAKWQGYRVPKVGETVTFQIRHATFPEDVGQFSGEIVEHLDWNEFIVFRQDGERFAVTQLSPTEFVGARGRIF